MLIANARLLLHLGRLCSKHALHKERKGSGSMGNLFEDNAEYGYACIFRQEQREAPRKVSENVRPDIPADVKAVFEEGLKIK